MRNITVKIHGSKKSKIRIVPHVSSEFLFGVTRQTAFFEPAAGTKYLNLIQIAKLEISENIIK